MYRLTTVMIVVASLNLASCGQSAEVNVAGGSPSSGETPAQTTTSVGPVDEQPPDAPSDRPENPPSTVVPSDEELSRGPSQRTNKLVSDAGENQNGRADPVTLLCWVNREITRRFLLFVGTDEDQQQASREVDTWLSAEGPGLADELDKVLSELPAELQPFASSLSDQLQESASSATRRTGSASPESSPLYEFDYDKLPNVDSYLEIAASAGCPQPL